MGLRATLIRDRLHGFRAASGSDLQPGTPTAASALQAGPAGGSGAGRFG